jgi:hypothetical protein
MTIAAAGDILHPREGDRPLPTDRPFGDTHALPVAGIGFEHWPKKLILLKRISNLLTHCVCLCRINNLFTFFRVLFILLVWWQNFRIIYVGQD